MPGRVPVRRAAYMHANARLMHHMAADRAVPAAGGGARGGGGGGAARMPLLSIMDEPYRSIAV